LKFETLRKEDHFKMVRSNFLQLVFDIDLDVISVFRNGKVPFISGVLREILELHIELV